MASKPRKPIDLGLDNYNELFMNEQERMENRLPRIYTMDFPWTDPALYTFVGMPFLRGQLPWHISP